MGGRCHCRDGCATSSSATDGIPLHHKTHGHWPRAGYMYNILCTNQSTVVGSVYGVVGYYGKFKVDEVVLD
jgi:hypothetical protein